MERRPQGEQIWSASPPIPEVQIQVDAKSHNRTHAVRQRSGRAFPAAIFGSLSVECPSNKFYGINCRSKLGAKLLDRFFHRRRQVSPPVYSLTKRLFDGSQHFLYRNFTVGSRHSAVASSPVPMRPPRTPPRTAAAVMAARCRQYHA